MLINLHTDTESGQQIKIEKRVGNESADLLGAFEYGTVLSIRMSVPRKLGAAAVVLRLAPDGGEDKDLPMSFTSSDGVKDTYEIKLDTKELCGEEGFGLFYYEYLFVRGWDTLFSSSVNNVDMTLSQKSESRFRLLVYEKGYKTPEWFHGATMYHIFVDRFCKGEGKTELHADAKINPDWHNGIPQYARKNGEPLANNVFFGGNLWGVIEKLEYLQSLGVTVLYLSPVFDAYSNHRYDTGDYEKIDSILGGDGAFDALIEAAHKKGMKVILDGVFNHTGDDSKYFNRRGRYPHVGAYQSKESPYYKWFNFRVYPHSYECWWSIEIMPRLSYSSEECLNYFVGEGGVCEKWLLRGADGWRLDVVDELPNAFLDKLRNIAKRTKKEGGLLIGEVWENAADKIAYGKRRRYFSGRQLDSVMNYPFRNAVLSLVLEKDTETFYNILTELYSSYPKEASNSLMNLLGTHDTERILTKLGDGGTGEGLTNDELAHMRLSENQRKEAVQKLKLASIIQYTVFGVPSVYYGDEAGLEGYHDPFCRLPFPWGEEDTELQAHYRSLGKLRREHFALKNGDFRFTVRKKDFIAYERANQNDRITVLINLSNEPLLYPLTSTAKDALTGIKYQGSVSIPPMQALILCE